MKKLKLKGNSKRKYTSVDDEDFEKLNKYKWYAARMGLGDQIYVVRNSPKGNERRMHRLIMKAKKGEMIDHINRDSLDNRRSNLRFCTASQNGMNSKLRCDNTSGVRGVRCRKERGGKWEARISFQKKIYVLGLVNKKQDAIKMRNEAEIRLYKEFRKDYQHGV